MLSLISQTKPTGIFQDGIMSLQHYASHQRVCIDPCVQSFSDQTPVTLSRIITVHFFQHFCHNLLERDIPSLSHRVYSSLYYFSRHVGPPTNVENTVPASHRWKIWCIASSQLGGGSEIAVPRFQCRVLRSSQTLRLSTRASWFRCLGSLQVKPKDSNLVLISFTDFMFSFTNMSSI